MSRDAWFTIYLYPELQQKFILYSKEKLNTIDYICVIIKYKDKDEQIFIDSINEKQDCNLNFYLKLATGLSNEKIINFQTKFREHFNRFDFDKNNIEHLTYLLTYLKGLSVKKFKYPLAILNSINGYEYNKDYSNSSSYCINYTKPIKDILISLIIKDEDCLNAIINTDFISDIKRTEIIKNDINLIQHLEPKYQYKITLDIIKLFINLDIDNLRYIDIDMLLKKDKKYTIKLINDFLLQKRKIHNISTIDKLITKYNKYI